MPATQVGQQRFLDQGFRQENTGPKIAKFVVGDPQFERRGKFPDELFRSYLSGLESIHQVSSAHPSGELGGRIVAERLQPGIGALEIERDDDVAEVKEDGLDHYYLGPLPTSC